MTLIVETPATRGPERDYIIDVVITRYLGLDWVRQSSNHQEVRITLAGRPGRAITLPDRLLGIDDAQWLSLESLPSQPLDKWDTRELGVEIDSLIDPVVPVIYGRTVTNVDWINGTIELPIDIFGSTFFMLARYEELIVPDRDEHDRFPVRASLADQEGFLQRPLIDEYVEILWAVINNMWPELNRTARQFEVNLSHDIDHMSRYAFCGPGQLLYRMAADGVRQRRWVDAMRAPWIWANRRRSLHHWDPYNTFDWLMDVAEDNGLTSAFYFMTGITDPGKDANYDIRHSSSRKLLRKIHDRGHEIGIHPSYNTYQRPVAIAEEADRLRAVCAEEGIDQVAWGGRMHYLRWDHDVTLTAWESAGMDYDSTLGYAETPGFRCGTCIEYPAYDIMIREPLQLRIRPLVAMERSALAPGSKDAQERSVAQDTFITLKKRCRMVSGRFTLLWHNSNLGSAEEREVLSEVLSC